VTNQGQTGGNSTAGSELGSWRQSFARHLRAANLSPMTVKAYLDAVDQLDRYLTASDPVPTVADINRAHIEGFLADQLARWRPATAANRHRSLKQFFRWLVDEEEIVASPMARIPIPRVPAEPPAVLTYGGRLKSQPTVRRDPIPYMPGHSTGRCSRRTC
jgi:site-specific recombinase XerD